MMNIYYLLKVIIKCFRLIIKIKNLQILHLIHMHSFPKIFLNKMDMMMEIYILQVISIVMDYMILLNVILA